VNWLFREFFTVTAGLLVVDICFIWQEPKGLAHVKIFYILFLVWIVSWKSGASALGLVSWMPQLMNIHFAHEIIAAVSIVNVS